MSRSFLVLLLLVTLTAIVVPDVGARVISYAPVTDQFGRPAIQKRDNRFYLLVESSMGFPPPSQVSAPVPMGPVWGTIVMHDASGVEEPRVLMRTAPEGNVFTVAAMHQASDGAFRILVGTDADLNGRSAGVIRYLYSPDGGATWKVLPLDPTYEISDFFRQDVGGPIVRGRGAQVRLGTDATPFVFAAVERKADYTLGQTAVVAVDANGSLRTLQRFAAGSGTMLIGGDRDGTSFLVVGRPESAAGTADNGIRTIRLDGSLADVKLTSQVHTSMEGWITPSKEVFVESQYPGTTQQLLHYKGGVETSILPLPPQTTASGPLLFSVPTANFDGAWIVRRTQGQPTKLYRHDGVELVEQWSDVTAPEVEALHVGSSGERLMIQVHRPRAADGRIVIDPALAIWPVGAPAPVRYDELFLSEGPAKMFVSLDVDAAAEGAPFIFDSAPIESLPASQVSAGGGGDVSQEWGIVRGSLHQRLVLPALARLEGAYGSFWKTDIVLQNDDTTPLEVRLRFVPSGATTGVESSVVLEPNELRLVPDALKALFYIDTGGGALFLTPEPGRDVGVTSRTYSESKDGTFGMGVSATDVYAASSARFPLTFAGAFQGASTRTNILITDAGGRGANFGFLASGPTGPLGRTDLEFRAPAEGQIQLNDLATLMSLPAGQSGALRFDTRKGQTIPMVVSIDNRTNDPTMFPPDVAAGVMRVIPIIGHVDGANGSRFRTDLFLYNPSRELKSIGLASKPLDQNVAESIVHFTLLPFESKLIPDVYQSVFQRTGVGRLRFWSNEPWAGDGIRVSARIYSVDDSGGTYGYVMPALNGFQSAGAGESLDILGGVIDSRFRLNLAIVDVAGQANGGTQRIKVEVFASGGVKLDSFETNVPNAGGVQLTDLFTSRGITSAEPKAVLIRVTPAGGLFGAFATIIDNRTNDPMYLGAGLSSE